MGDAVFQILVFLFALTVLGVVTANFFLSRRAATREEVADMKAQVDAAMEVDRELATRGLHRVHARLDIVETSKARSEAIIESMGSAVKRIETKQDQFIDRELNRNQPPS